jgi:hypothetical protein
MVQTLVREPFHRDGWRMVACKDGGRVRLVSRNGRDPHAPIP